MENLKRTVLYNIKLTLYAYCGLTALALTSRPYFMYNIKRSSIYTYSQVVHAFIPCVLHTPYLLDLYDLY